MAAAGSVAEEEDWEAAASSRQAEAEALAAAALEEATVVSDSEVMEEEAAALVEKGYSLLEEPAAEAGSGLVETAKEALAAVTRKSKPRSCQNTSPRCRACTVA
jgi:hypothetical protein